MLLLDTCTFLWLVGDQSKLSDATKSAIQLHCDQLCISAISVLEIGIKNARKKLTLPLPLSEWYPEALQFHSINEIALSGDISITAAQLPMLHNDPFDRIIIATALEHQMVIATPDPLFGAYPGVRTIW